MLYSRNQSRRNNECGSLFDPHNRINGIEDTLGDLLTTPL